MRIWHQDGEIVFEVSDAGEGIQDALAGQLAPPRPASGGRGLWLTRLLCDAVEIRERLGVHSRHPRDHAQASACSA